jgi:SNF2 family DNA or RNA helicase
MVLSTNGQHAERDVVLQGPHLNFSLYDFQRVPVIKFRSKRSRLIADDMGLGKTYEAIALDLVNRWQCAGKATLQQGAKSLPLPGHRKTLIIAPLSVLPVWETHLAKLTPHNVYVINTKNRSAFSRVATSNASGYFVCHWEALHLMPELQKVFWFHIIADECHRLKGMKKGFPRKGKKSSSMPKMVRAAKGLKSVYKTALSGTPADNKPDDIWGTFNWLWPNYYTSYWNFRKLYCKEEQAENKAGNLLGYRHITGVQNIHLLRKEMEPWYIRRKKEEVLDDLPDKYYSEIPVDLHPLQRKAYDQMKKTMVAWLQRPDIAQRVEAEDPMIASVVVAQLQRLQQFALGYMELIGYREVPNKNTGAMERKPVYKMIDPSSKLDAVMELLEDTDEQVVIFSQFKSAINLLASRLEAGGWQGRYGLLTGDTKQSDRGRLVEQFQGGRLKVFASTIRTGGVGITLTSASTAVFLDRAWVPGDNTQAEDRLHRIGQSNAVHIIDIIARNSVDRGRLQSIENKASWIRQILGDE